MNQLQTFVNDEMGKYIRSIQIDNEPWFVGKDITNILGYKNGSRDIVRHVFEEDRKYLTYEEFQKYRNGIVKTKGFKGYQNGDFEIQQYQNGIAENLNHFGTTIINESGVYALIFGSKLESARKFKHWVTSEVLPSLRKYGAYGNMDPEYRLKCAEIVSRTPAHAIKATAHMLGFDIPDNCLMSERRQKQLAENPLKDFIETIDEIQPFTPVQILWDNYLKWCESNSINPITRIDFSRKLVVFLDREIVNKKINGIKTRVIA